MEPDHNLFRYDVERCWFHQMWHVDSWCGTSYIYDNRGHVAYDYDQKPYRMPPVRWHPKMRENVLKIVCPD